MENKEENNEILNEIKESSKRIEKMLIDMKKSSDNMDDHIGFVESIYTVVKNPFIGILKYCYGFNGQNIIQKLENKKCKYELINCNDTDN
jgi:hypothetical protein